MCILLSLSTRSVKAGSEPGSETGFCPLQKKFFLATVALFSLMWEPWISLQLILRIWHCQIRRLPMWIVRMQVKLKWNWLFKLLLFKAWYQDKVIITAVDIFIQNHTSFTELLLPISQTNQYQNDLVELGQTKLPWFFSPWIQCFTENLDPASYLGDRGYMFKLKTEI